MEFYSKMNKMLVIAIGVMSTFGGACTSDALDDANDLINDASTKIGLVKNADGTETIILSNGEQIILEDTTTYIINFEATYLENMIDDNMVETRAVAPTGYDRQVIPSKNKKYLLLGLEKFGISPTTTYIGKYITYYKDLPVSKGYSLLPSINKYANVNKMGFNPPSLTTIGFNTIAPSAWTGFETGVTQIFYVKSDAAGITWNRNVPCNPTDLTWYYRAIPDEE